jgi:hypothetical protein
MNGTLRKLGVTALLVVLPILARTAEAIPILQLDMKGGVYDPVTETVVAPGGTFTVYAILTPPHNATPAQVTALLNTTYFLSAALSPKTTPPGGSLGSFKFGLPGTNSTCTESTSGTPGPCPQTINATTDMAYGVPPLELVSSRQGWDATDLSKHDVFETYFSEFSFKFSPLDQTAGYNVQNTPGGPQAGSGAYYAAFVGDSSLLSAGFNLHFDVYNQTLKDCSTRTTPCTDVDRDMFAPFSHDAGTTTTTRVPEPGAALLMLAGIAVGGRQMRRRAIRG